MSTDFADGTIASADVRKARLFLAQVLVAHYWPKAEKLRREKINFWSDPYCRLAYSSFHSWPALGEDPMKSGQPSS